MTASSIMDAEEAEALYDEWLSWAEPAAAALQACFAALPEPEEECDREHFLHEKAIAGMYYGVVQRVRAYCEGDPEANIANSYGTLRAIPNIRVEYWEEHDRCEERTSWP